MSGRACSGDDPFRDFFEAFPGEDAGAVAVAPGDTDGVIAEGVDGGGFDIGCDGFRIQYLLACVFLDACGALTGGADISVHELIFGAVGPLHANMAGLVGHDGEGILL